MSTFIIIGAVIALLIAVLYFDRKKRRNKRVEIPVVTPLEPIDTTIVIPRVDMDVNYMPRTTDTHPTHLQ